MTLDARVATRDATRGHGRAAVSVGLALASLLTLGSPVRADEGPAAVSLPPSLGPGVRVRVTAGAGGSKDHSSTTGTLAALDASQITVDMQRPGTGSSRVRIPLETVSKLEVSQGHHGHALVGAVFGFAGAAAAGAILGDSGPGVSCVAPPNPCGGSDPKLGWALATGLVGLPVGALLGHFVRTESWTSVDVPRLDVTAGPLPGRGLRVVGRLRF
jgi:hypothetical protein